MNISSDEPLVYTITLNWNTKEDTAECIRSLKELDYTNMVPIVVDNGSTDDSVEFLRKEFRDSITIIENEKNLGYSKGFNVGIYYAMKKNPDYLLIHNSDIIFDKDALKELVKIAETDENIGFVSGKVYFYNKPDVIQTAGKIGNISNLSGVFPNVGANEKDKGQYDEIKEYDFIDDVFLLVRSKVVEEVGAYDSDFFLMYEITDWCYRVRKKGYRIVYTPYAKVWHKGSLSSGGLGNPLSKYYLSRNQILFMKKSTPPNIFVRYLIRTLSIGLFKEIIVYLLKLRLDMVESAIKGRISGVIWLLSDKERS